MSDVVYPAKVQISKQITTEYAQYGFDELDVVYPAKVQISKQITTRAHDEMCVGAMLFTLQRYKFLSKSQPKDMIKY